MKTRTGLYHFNRGTVSRLALARLDVKRTALSAETMTNWMPRVMGSMMLRPGLQYLGSINSKPKMLPFVFATGDTALVEITDVLMRVWVNDKPISRPVVTSAVTNGTFDANIAGWTDNDEGTAASTWAVGGYMQLLGTGSSAAIRDQIVTCLNTGTEHALRITIQRGPVMIRVGTAAGDDSYITETELGTGVHSLAFTPSGNFNIRFFARQATIALVDSCVIESAGIMQLPAPWSGTDLQKIRSAQSADVLFIACKGYQQRKIERHSGRSWSVVLYTAPDGPFRTANIGPITIAASAITGNITLTASSALFKSTQVGGLYQLTSVGQRVTASIAAANTFTSTIQVTGSNEARRFAITLSGVWVATVTLQRSVGVIGVWEDVTSYTGNVSETYADGLDRQIVYYRIGIKAAAYTSGTVVATLSFSGGSITGVARITAFTSTTIVDAEVLADLGGTDATDSWAEGSWSARRGYPTAVALYEGRLWWSGKNGIYGSVSDAFDSFDPALATGASGPINRTVGSGPVDNINWILPLQRLLLGGDGAELSVRSTAFDEPLSPTNFNIKEASTQGSSALPAVKFDSRGLYVQRGGSRVYELAFDPQSYDYGSTDLTVLVPEIGQPSIVAIAIQRQPDTRIHCVRSDGLVAVGVIDRAENVLSWQLVETEGVVEDVVVTPSDTEDNVYYVVKRMIGAMGISALSVTPGTSYTSQPTLAFSGGGGANAAGTVDLTLLSFTVAAAGAGYAINDVLQFVGGTTTGATTILVTAVDGGGGVTAGTVIGTGSYTVLPANAVATTTSGAGGGCTITATWSLGSATITSAGGGYSTAPTVTVTGGGGSGGAVTATIATTTLTGHYLEKWAAEAACVGGLLNKQADSFIVSAGSSTVVAGGIVSSLSVTPGTGYTSPPTLSFAGGAGSGAAATVNLAYDWVGGARGHGFADSGIDGFYALENFGAGYSVGDILTLVGGTYTRPAKFRVVSVFSGGEIYADNHHALDVVDYGSYSVVPASGFGPTIACTGGTGSGAAFRGWWALGEATLTSPGTGYTSAPTVTLTGGAGTDGSVTASVSIGTSQNPSSLASISGLNHLEGKQVVVWGDGIDLSPDVAGVQTTYTVSNGAISLSVAVAQAVVGLPYVGRWKSSKLGHATDQGTTLGQRGKVTRLGLILADVHIKGIEFGPDFDTMNTLPEVDGGVNRGVDYVYTAYDFEPSGFPGGWSSDSRVCLRGKAPRPCTALGLVIEQESHG